MLDLPDIGKHAVAVGFATRARSCERGAAREDRLRKHKADPWVEPASKTSMA
jgi:hypothetical protein